MVSPKVTIRKFKMLYFRNERRHGTRNLTKDLFLGHLPPPKDKNSKHLEVLILEFDEVTVKTIYKAKMTSTKTRTPPKKKSFTVSFFQCDRGGRTLQHITAIFIDHFHKWQPI